MIQRPSSLVARMKDSRSWPRGLREARELREAAGSPPSGHCSSGTWVAHAWPLVEGKATTGSLVASLLGMTTGASVEVPEKGRRTPSRRGSGGARLKGVASAGWSGASESGNSEMGSTSEEEALGLLVRAARKLAAGRVFINVVRMLSRTKSWMRDCWRKRTSVLAGWTLTSTSWGGISRKRRMTGNGVGGMMLR